MGIRIPTKIKKYPGLVKAWKARHGSSGNLYDPPSKKRRISPPKTSTRHKTKRKYDPRRRGITTGYGKINKKPFKRGSRGGTYWSGGKTPRYDPRDYRGRNTRKKAKDKLEQIWQKFEKKINPIAMLVGFLATLIGVSYQSIKFHEARGYDAKHWFTQGIPNEIKQIFGMKGTWQDPLKYLEFKFFSPESHWSPPFIASLATYLLCKLGILDMGLSIITSKSKKIVAPIQKLSGGVLLASTIGALVLPGSGEKPTSSNPGHSTTTTHNPSSMWS